MKTKKQNTQKMVLCAILTAIVIILQFLGSFIHFGTFSISLVLIPIVIGAASCGLFAAGWLGFVFGLVVLISGDASVFLAVNPIGTVITVILKGVLCGLAAGVAYKGLCKTNTYLAIIASAIVCPLVNTGIFLLGCFAFFMGIVSEWASSLGFGSNVVSYMIIGLVGANFLFEMGFNVVLSPVIVRLLNAKSIKLT